MSNARAVDTLQEHVFTNVHFLVCVRINIGSRKNRCQSLNINIHGGRWLVTKVVSGPAATVGWSLHRVSWLVTMVYPERIRGQTNTL